MDVRLARLEADRRKLAAVMAAKPPIKIVETVGEPPERYLLEYNVRTLARNEKTGRIEPQATSRVEITLSEGYPRLAPACRMVTPVFHPNIVTEAVCVHDHWSASASLSHLVLRIGELLAFQSYSLKFPLNPEAATYLESHLHELPTDPTDFVAVLHRAEGVRRENQADLRPYDHCVACGKTADQVSLYVTENHHVVCEECMILCAHCQVVMSNRSPMQECTVCTQKVCYKCIHRCLSCSKLVCFDHMVKCQICDLGHCPGCVIECAACHAVVCVEHAAPVEREGQTMHLCEKCLLATGGKRAADTVAEEPDDAGATA
jgi:hypothetical protein